MSPELNKVLNNGKVSWKEPQTCFIKGNICQVLLYALKREEQKSKNLFNSASVKLCQLEKAATIELSSKGELLS